MSKSDPCSRWGNTASELRKEASIVDAMSRSIKYKPSESSRHLVIGKTYSLGGDGEVCYLGENLYEVTTSTSRIRILSGIESFDTSFVEKFSIEVGRELCVVPWCLCELNDRVPVCFRKLNDDDILPQQNNIASQNLEENTNTNILSRVISKIKEYLGN